MLWVDFDDPGRGERAMLTDVFHFHELAVEDALSELHHPKIETYDGLPVPDPAWHRFPASSTGSRRTTSISSSAANYPRDGARRSVAHRSRGARPLRASSSACSADGAGPRCCTASSIDWSTTTGLKWRSSRSGSTSSRSRCSSGREQNRCARILDLKERRRLAAPGRRCRSATRSRGSRGASSRRSPSRCLPLSRRLRPPRATGR